MNNEINIELWIGVWRPTIWVATIYGLPPSPPFSMDYLSRTPTAALIGLLDGMVNTMRQVEARKP